MWKTATTAEFKQAYTQLHSRALKSIHRECELAQAINEWLEGDPELGMGPHSQEWV